MSVGSSGEVLREAAEFRLVRNGRFVVAELLVPHRVLSTSARNGGQREGLRFLVNHQSCEGTDHRERHAVIMGNAEYHDLACGENWSDPALAAMMQTVGKWYFA